MRKREEKKYRRILLRELAAHVGSAVRKLAAGATRLDVADEGDRVNAEQEKVLLALGAASDSKVAKAIMRALRRMDAGEYGKCRSCGKSIAKIRLDAVPWATLCTPCKEQEGNGQPARFTKSKIVSPSTRLAINRENNRNKH